jgi:hypothetical protein
MAKKAGGDYGGSDQSEGLLQIFITADFAKNLNAAENSYVGTSAKLNL